MDASLVVIVVVLAGLGWVILHRPGRSREPESGTLSGPGTFKVEVVGESHYQEALERICGGRAEDSAEKPCRATLVLEDSNPYDRNAVRIDVDGTTVGYLPRDSAKVYRQRLKEAGRPRLCATCNAPHPWRMGPWPRGHRQLWYLARSTHPLSALTFRSTGPAGTCLDLRSASRRRAGYLHR